MPWKDILYPSEIVQGKKKKLILIMIMTEGSI